MTNPGKMMKMWFMAVAVLLVPACTDRPDSLRSGECLPESWAWAVMEYPDQNWNHDGHPYESAHFLVYSLLSSDRAKKTMAEFAEGSLDSLMDQLQFLSDQEMGIDARLEIYAKHCELAWGARAYPEGIVMDAVDSRMFAARSGGDSAVYKAQIKHELVHIVQFRFNSMQALWFDEGLAEYLSGPVVGVPIATTSGPPITTLDGLNAWRSRGWANPITIMDPEDYPETDPENSWWQYYPVFRLAVAYLFDAKGRGAARTQIRCMFDDMKAGMRFEETFETRIGMTVAHYRDHFYEMMEAYLSTPTGL